MLLLELLDSIDRYLIGISGVHDLEEWVVANLQRILDSGDDEAIRLVNEVDASLVEMGEGLIDPVTLHSHLDTLVREARTISSDFAESAILTRNDSESTSDSISWKMEEQAFTPVKDLRLVHDFG